MRGRGRDSREDNDTVKEGVREREFPAIQRVNERVRSSPEVIIILRGCEAAQTHTSARGLAALPRTNCCRSGFLYLSPPEFHPSNDSTNLSLCPSVTRQGPREVQRPIWSHDRFQY
mgnify:CR=1 FL=1